MISAKHLIITSPKPPQYHTTAPRHNAFSHRRSWSLLLALVLVCQLAVGSQADDWGDMAVFWGRNKSEREACETAAYNTILISFLRTFGHGQYSLDLSGHPLAGVADDIKHCRSKGILVLLSIGGPGYGGGSYSLPSAQSAADVAAYLWDAYLGGSCAGVRRPFGDVAVDGVDFYIDQGPTAHYDELARLLYAYNKNYRGRLGVTLTATVRCKYPDPRVGTALISRIHVRLYGDLRCDEAFGRYDIEDWAAKYPGSRVFIGVTAEDKHGAGDLKGLYYGIVQYVDKLPNYGGIMIWNRYYDKMNHFIANS